MRALPVQRREKEWYPVQRDRGSGTRKTFTLPRQSVDACRNFSHYRTLKERYQVLGAIPEERKGKLRPDACPGGHGRARKSHVHVPGRTQSAVPEECTGCHGNTTMLSGCLPGEEREL